MAFGRPPMPPPNPAFAKMAAMKRALKKKQPNPAEEAAESPQMEASEPGY